MNPMRMLDKDLMGAAHAGRRRHDARGLRQKPPHRDAGRTRGGCRGRAADYEALADKYGEDIQLLQMPEKAAGKEKLSCDMVQEMWAEGAVAAEQRAGVIRLAVSELE